tara:strand:- start:9527 stop:10135 length:609 start_codon:yes stop_codon:yes gene_type:complete
MARAQRDDYSVPRPVCQTEGCEDLAHNTASADKPVWRKYCGKCHNLRRKNFQNLSSNLTKRQYPTCTIKNCRKKATLLGTNHEGELKFSEYCEQHGGTPYHLQWRKPYCENIDGRLGFKCTTTIYYDPPLPKSIEWLRDYGFPQPMLQVDHMDGNPYNEPTDGSNFQTLCACCHTYKTWKSGDSQTAGRKQLKEAANNNEIK